MDLTKLERIVAWCKRHGYLLAFVLAIVVALPTLGMGLFLDDHMILAALRDMDVTSQPYDLYRLAPGIPDEMRAQIAQGRYLWFTHPEFKMHFARPLSSVLMMLDDAVFGDFTVGHHAHSIFWYLVLVGAVALLFRRVLPRSLAVLALVLFVVDEVHWLPVGWWCNRNSVIAMALSVFALCAHMRWREEGWRPGALLSPVLFAVALTAGEAALGMLGYVFCWEMLAGPGKRPRRLLAMAPLGVLVLGYLGIYAVMGYGAASSATYINPIRDPLMYVSTAPGRMLGMLAGQLLAIPADLWMFAPPLAPFLAALGVAGLALFAVLLRWAWAGLDEGERRVVLWTCGGAILSLLPVAATFPTGRLLMMPSLGAAVATAVIVRHWWRWRIERKHAVPPPEQAPVRIPRFARTGVYFLIATNLILAPLAWPALSALMRSTMDDAEQIAANPPITPPSNGEPQRVVLVNSSDPIMTVFPPLLMALLENKPRPERWWALSMAPFSHRVTRTASDRIELEIIDGQMMTTTFEHQYRRASLALEPGDTVRFDGLAATILAANDRGPTKVAFVFDPPLDDPSYDFLVWQDDNLRPFHMPAVGESVVIEKNPGFMNLDYSVQAFFKSVDGEAGPDNAFMKLARYFGFFEEDGTPAGQP
ncbi:MAG: hypothetical protein ACLFTT_16175 [Candidatus Hydrogenedentota bacterium]